MGTHRFRFTPAYRLPALLFTITPARAWVRVTDTELHMKFGFWKLRTPRENISCTRLTGDYSLIKTAGPARLSLADHGVTFATNSDQGLCICFHEPVRVLSKRLLHPGITVTVADPQRLKEELTAD